MSPARERTAERKPGKLWAVVLAGGSGTRLEPFLRESGHPRPVKQFCAIVGQRSMLQHTWDRAEMLVPPSQVLTVVDATHFDMFPEQLATRPPGTVISQPRNCETAAGVLLALAHLLRADPQAVVAIFPSDHFIIEEERFMRHVQIADWVVRRGICEVALLGVAPDRPDSDYGWIEIDRAGRHRGSCLLPVHRFTEKPSAAVAASLYERGHLWSTMVTVAQAATLWELAREVQPQLYELFDRVRRSLRTGNADLEIGRAYAEMPYISFSSGLLECAASRLGAIAVRGVHWNDWGCEHRVNESLRHFGKARNLCAGYGAQRSPARAERRGP